MEYYMTDERIAEYLKALENEERAAATIEKYRRALLSFAAFFERRGGHTGDDPPLERRSARK